MHNKPTNIRSHSRLITARESSPKSMRSSDNPQLLSNTLMPELSTQSHITPSYSSPPRILCSTLHLLITHSLSIIGNLLPVNECPYSLDQSEYPSLMPQYILVMLVAHQSSQSYKSLQYWHMPGQYHV